MDAHLQVTKASLKRFFGLAFYQIQKDNVITRALLCFDVVGASAARGQKARLLSDLLEGYDPDVRPVKNDTYPAEPKVVNLSMTYNQLQNLVSI